MSDPVEQPVARPSLPRRILRFIANFAIIALILILGAWATAAISMANLDGASLRIVLPALFAIAFLGALFWIRPRFRARLVACAMIGAVALWYFTIFPSNSRNWIPEHAKLATATIAGDRITIHNYRVLE